MNKKFLSLIIALLFMVVLTGCIERVEEIDPTKPLAAADSSLKIANPMKEMSREELIEKTGIDLGTPEGAEDMVYSMIELSEGRPIAQLRFELEGHELCFRAQTVDGKSAAGDISGLYYNWAYTHNTFVARLYAVVNVSGDVGYIKWIDAENGVQYSLSMTEGADEKLLVELADKVFASILV